MAEDVRPALTEETLRETKDDLLTRVTEQQRQVGMLPEVDRAEAFILPILAKVAVDHEEDRARDAVRASARQRQAEVLEDARRRRIISDPTVTYSHAGEFSWNLDTDEVRPTGGSPFADAETRRRLAEGRLRAQVRGLLGMPAWRERFDAVGALKVSTAERDRRYAEILRDAAAQFSKGTR